MIVFDLKCGGGHVFEAWFGTSDAYADQRARGLVACPLCGDTAVNKAVMAPNVAAKGNRGVTAPPPAATEAAPPAAPAPSVRAVPDPAAIKAALAALATAQATLLEQSQWVGSDFATRARAMHDGDEPVAMIHGQTTRDEAEALIDDGIPVAPLLIPIIPPQSRN